MATYKKQLRDKDNNVIYPAQGLGTITSENIDWTTTAQSYSTSEVNTGATWIDGKPIYKKTIDFGALKNSSGASSVAHGISNLDRVIKAEAIAKSSSSSAPQLVIPWATTGSNSANIYIEIYSSNITIGVGENRSSYSAVITLWYTKTTD